MARIAIVCEGRDDQHALREYLERWPILAEENDQHRFRRASAQGSPLVFENGSRHSVEVWTGSGKQPGLAQRTFDAAAPAVGSVIDAVLVSFDPDTSTEPSTEFDFFVDQFGRELAGGRANDGFGPIVQREHGRYSFSLRERSIALIPLPWRTAASPLFDSLPDERNLERVLIEGIVEAVGAGEEAAWAIGAVESLRRLVPDHGWKRALRIWNAALYPKVSEDSFVAHLFQNRRTRAACFKAVDAIGLHAHLVRLLPVETK